jgi:hypothetical protein
MAEQSKNTYFKIDPECHLIGELESVNHFPGVQMWWRTIKETGGKICEESVWT